MPDQSSSTACPEQPPLRIGVWCKAGGKTLGPDNACGVYLFNLLAGLLRLEDAVEVVLFVGPDYQGEYATVARQGAGRVRIWPYLPPAVAPPQPPLAATASLPSSVRSGLRQRGTEILHHARRS